MATPAQIPLFLNITKVALPDNSRGVVFTVQIGQGESAPLQTRLVLTPENAITVGKRLIEVAQEAATGLVLPPPGIAAPS